jgi:hypothetical protein
LRRIDHRSAADQGDNLVRGGTLRQSRWLPTITGRAPDVHRFDASVKYRFWLPNDLGLDVGLTYGKGRETKTYKDEDKVEIGLGVLF